MKKVFLGLKKSSVLFPVLLSLLTVVLCAKNYTRGTFLTGWDTLHPEFNYLLYFKRILGGVWQEHQGLGAVASQAHASEISRMIIYLILDLFFSLKFVRYAYYFLMLIIGPLGVYFFIKNVFFKNISSEKATLGAFSGGVFYLLNFGTLQHFVVPLEMFTTHYGFLGWLFLFLSKFLDFGKKKDLVWFSIITFFMTSQAHTPTLFYALFVYLIAYLFFRILLGKGKLKRAGVLLLITLVINAFWLMPSAYFAIKHGSEVQESKIHHLFSDEAFLANKKFGTIKDITVLRNFLFDWGVHTGNGSYKPVLESWLIYFKNDIPTYLGYLFFGFIVIGVVLSGLRKNRQTLSLGVMFLVGWFFILNVNPPFGFIFTFFQQHIPLFEEVFRFPFTKFSIPLMFVYAVFFGSFVGYISDLIKKQIIGIVLVSLITFSQILYFKPAFKGQFLSPYMRVDIPNRYFSMFKYFNDQEEYGRVANLPINSFWGWTYNGWDFRELGYQGAGFLWFGIKQPLINREFDRWNILNEQPYRQLSTAIYSQDVDLLVETLDKFKIRWLILDESVIAPGYNSTILFINETKELFDSIENIKLAENFGGGLLVYEYIPANSFENIEKTDTYVLSGNTLFKEYKDPIYSEYGNYILKGDSQYLFLGNNGVDENYVGSDLSPDENHIRVNYYTEDSRVGNVGRVPLDVSLQNEETGIKVFLETVDTGVIFDGLEFPFVLSVNKKIYNIKEFAGFLNLGSQIIDVKNPVEITAYKEGEIISIDSKLYSSLEACSSSETAASYSITKYEDGFDLSGKNILACTTIALRDIREITKGDLISIRYGVLDDMKAGDVCLLDNNTGLCAERFIQGLGYTLFSISDSSNYNLRFFADSRNIEGEHVKSYRNIQLVAYKPIFSQDVSLQEVDLVAENKGFWSLRKDPLYTLYPNDLVGNRRACNYGARISSGDFIGTEKGVVFNSTDDSLCDSYVFPTASHKIGYILEVKAKNIEGVPLRLCLTNEVSKRCDIDVSIPEGANGKSLYYFVPPMGEGTGYTLNVSNYVFGDSPSKNELEYISLVPAPYDLIKTSKTEELEKGTGNLMILNEAYEDGWVAICGMKLCSADHVMVNNWANGWVFEEKIPENVKIVFWPQFLQYLGFLLYIPLVLYIVRYGRKSEKQENATISFVNNEKQGL